VQGVVRGAVTAAVETVPVGASAAGGQRCRAAQVRQGGFGAQPVRVVAGGGQQLPGDIGSDAEHGAQGEGGAGDGGA
jgi:hypothetical protein